MSAGKGREKINQVAGFKEGRAKKDDSISGNHIEIVENIKVLKAK